MKKTLPGYMILAMYSLDVRGLQPAVEVLKSSFGWIMSTVQVVSDYRLCHFIRFRVMLDSIPEAVRKWASEDHDIKRILVEVEL